MFSDSIVCYGHCRGDPAGVAREIRGYFPHLEERQRRLLMGSEARASGHGGIRAVAQAAGVRVATVAAGLLRAEGFSLQANVNTLEGKAHPDRDGQFRYLYEQVKD